MTDGTTYTKVSIWDEENRAALSDIFFNCLYALNDNKFQDTQLGARFTYRDICLSKVLGCYFPPKDRIFYSDSIDFRNDGLPGLSVLSGLKDFFNYGCPGPHPDISTCLLYPIKYLPSGVRGFPGGVHYYYKIQFWEFFESGMPTHLFSGGELIASPNLNLRVWTDYVAVNPSKDTINRCWWKNSFRGLNPVWLRWIFATTASATADRRYLWNVSLYYPFGDVTTGLWLDFGVEEEYVKSLFYSRNLPLTSSGRKRPIEHWVNAHNRRLKSGVNVEIQKYLRGITEFEMLGYKFIIVSPRKDSCHELLEEKNKMLKSLQGGNGIPVFERPNAFDLIQKNISKLKSPTQNISKVKQLHNQTRS